MTRGGVPGETASGAVLLDDDDARARLRKLNRVNSSVVRAVGSNLLTIRIDLE